MNIYQLSVLNFIGLLWAFSSSAQVCVSPGLPVLDEQLDEGVIISWEAGGNEVYWDIDYGRAPYTPSEVSPFIMRQVTKNTEVFLREFLPNETYELYVRAECTDHPDYPEFSDWVGPLSFKTFTDLCRYPEVLIECQREKLGNGFPNEVYDISCTGSEAGNNWFLEFTPRQSEEYFFHSDLPVTSLVIREKEVCNELNWQCMFDGSMGNRHSLGDLEMNTSYQILFRAERSPEIVIGQCESVFFTEYNVDSFDADLSSLDFVLSSDGLPIEGVFDLFFVEEEMPAPQSNSLPTLSSLSVIDGMISFPTGQLMSDTDFNMYIRPVCTSLNSCWEGPFNFRTPINCGGAPGSFRIDPRSVNADMTIESMSGQSWRIQIGEAPFAEPDPSASGTNNLLSYNNSTRDSITYTFLNLQALTTYQFYLKRNCSNSPIVIENQPWYGPFEFTTNSDCYIDIQDLNCGQCYASLPAYGHNYYEATVTCGNDRAPSRGERIFRIQQPTSGQVTINRDQGGGEPGETIIYQFYLKSASEVCDLEDWKHLGCWSPAGGFANRGDIIIDVEADSVYYLMIDYQTESTFRYNYIRFFVTADNCDNECPPIQNLDFRPINEENVLLTWDSTPDAIGYDLVSVPVGESPNPYPCLYKYSSLFEELIHPDTFYLLSDLSLNEPRDVYVRSRCSELNYSPWTMLEIESQMGESVQYSNMGTLQYCSPTYIFNRQTVLYDQLTFTVPEDGWYQIQQRLEGSSFFNLYEEGFDPELPTQNYIATAPDHALNVDEITLWQFLETGKDYIVVSSARPGWSASSEEITLTISGKALASSDGYEYLGIADGPSGTVPATSGINYISNQVCVDANGWRHYYETDGTLLNLDKDALLFSIIDYPEINRQVGMDVLTISGTAGTSLITNTAENYVSQPEGWITMNRFWDLVLDEEQQPTAPIGIRFYYTEEDFQSLADALPLDSIINHSDLSFYKINQNATGFNTNPAGGHLDVPLAQHCADEGYWEYAFAAQADTTFWSYGMHKDAHFAELLVHEFSGGGGGVGSAINFSTSIDEIASKNQNWVVYPNPIHQEVFIRLQNGESPPDLIQCFDMNGLMISVEVNKLGSEVLSVNTSDWASGIYFIKMRNDTALQVEILVKP